MGFPVDITIDDGHRFATITFVADSPEEAQKAGAILLDKITLSEHDVVSRNIFDIEGKLLARFVSITIL